MKRKIGLFLGGNPTAGGTFQYNISMLEAVAALPQNHFSVVVGYKTKLWRTYLADYNIKQVFLPTGFWERVIGKTWGFLGLPISLWRQIPSRFRPIYKALLCEQCNLWIFPSQLSWSYMMPVPALIAIHDLMHRYEPQFSEVSAKKEYNRREALYTNICRWAKGVLVDSETGKQQVSESYGMAEDKIHVLPYVAPKYIWSNRVVEDFDSRYTLPKKYLFYPAQFWEHKNHKRLINAIDRLKPDIPDLRLILVGSRKNGYESARKLVNRLNLNDSILFFGYIPDQDMIEFYRRARALIMPTFFGPTNIPPLEAFVTGCPVAISGIYGMPEQMGDAALLFDPNSEDEIGEAILKLWTDDRLCQALSLKGKVKAQHWGQAQFNDKLSNIIAKVLTIP